MRLDEYLLKRDALADEERLGSVPLVRACIAARAGKGRRILEVGCGGGSLARALIERNNEVWGVELHPEAARRAEARGVHVKQADAEKGWPFGPSEFDTVVAD